MSEFERISRSPQNAEDPSVSRRSSRDEGRSPELEPLPPLTHHSFGNYPWVSPRTANFHPFRPSHPKPESEKANGSPNSQVFLAFKQEERERLRNEARQLLPTVLERLENQFPNGRLQLETYRRLVEIGRQVESLKGAIANARPKAKPHKFPFSQASLTSEPEERERLRGELQQLLPTVLERLDAKIPSDRLPLETYRQLVEIGKQFEGLKGAISEFFPLLLAEFLSLVVKTLWARTTVQDSNGVFTEKSPISQASPSSEPGERERQQLASPVSKSPASPEDSPKTCTPIEENNWQITSYWIPSTDTLNRMQDAGTRTFFFEQLLNPCRVPRVGIVYIDVLASVGATVNNETLAKAEYLNEDEDVLEELHAAAEAVGRNLSDPKDPNYLRIVPWIEGSGITLKRDEENSLYQIARRKQDDDAEGASEQGDRPPAILGTFVEPKENEAGEETFPGVYFTDILDDRVFDALKAFTIELAERDRVNEIIVDDHFGIKLASDPEVRKRIVANHQLDGMSVGEQNEWMRDRLTERIKELSEALQGKAVLSVSVHAFDFDTESDRLEQKQGEEPITEAERQENSKDPSTWNVGRWDLALKLNLQDVARWIEGGFITGELNVQIPPSSDGLPRGVIEKYDAFIDGVRAHLKQEHLSREYVENFPEISVSIYAEGTGWGYFPKGGDPRMGEKGPLYLEAIIARIEENSIIETQYDRVITVRAVGFDYLDFTKVKKPASTEEEQ